MRTLVHPVLFPCATVVAVGACLPVSAVLRRATSR
jgi:hypothetical protein